MDSYYLAFGVDVSTNDNAERLADYSVNTIDVNGTYSPVYRIHAEKYTCRRSPNSTQVRVARICKRLTYKELSFMIGYFHLQKQSAAKCNWENCCQNYLQQSINI